MVELWKKDGMEGGIGELGMEREREKKDFEKDQYWWEACMFRDCVVV